MKTLRMCAWWVLLALTPAALAQRSVRELFTVDRSRPASVVVLMPGVDEAAPERSGMLDSLAGVAARLDRRGITELTRLTAGVGREDPAEPVLHCWTVVLEHDEEIERVELYRDANGRPFASREGSANRFIPLNPIRFGQLTREWESLDFSARDGEAPVGRVVELDGGIAPGRFVLDRETIGDRVYRGQGVRVASAERDLDRLEVFARLPRGYDGSMRAGVIVWIDPTDRGLPPEALFEGADELGLILVGVADMGNDRPVMDRFQAAFDAIETVGRRWRIDRERVYVTGMSGGGRASSMLWGCFPDVFAGAVPIVGLNSYRRAVVDRREAPATFTRPTGRLLGLLRDRPIAPMSGPLDFNYEQMKAYAAGLEDDGMRVRFFDYADMGHVMPTPGRFAEAIRWVDEPRREQLTEIEARGGVLWLAHVEAFGEGPPATEEGWASLVDITREAPWSRAAWRAAGMIAERDALLAGSD